jgi:hypothetical protein
LKCLSVGDGRKGASVKNEWTASMKAMAGYGSVGLQPYFYRILQTKMGKSEKESGVYYAIMNYLCFFHLLLKIV